MEYISLGFILFLGLCFGSFLSVIVFRLDNKEGILFGRSECQKCLTRLKWYDLIPLASFLYLGGKCRYCGTKVSAVYPAMELITAGSFVTYCLLNGYYNLNNFYDLAIIFIFLTLFFYDYIFYILPDKLIAVGLIISLAYSLYARPEAIVFSLLTGLVLASFFAILHIGSKGSWVGFGDSKLALLIGFALGYPYGILAILLSVWAGAIWGISLIIIGKANLKTPLPFGSFMTGAAIILIILQKYEIWNFIFL